MSIRSFTQTHSCLFFLLVASESTKINKNLDEHQNAHTTTTTAHNLKNNYDRIEEIKRHNFEHANTEHDFYNSAENGGNAAHFRHEINAYLQEQEEQQQKQHQHEKQKDDEGGGGGGAAAHNDDKGGDGARQINTEFLFLDTISKNSGVTENE